MTATTATSATSGARTAGAGALLIMAALASASACWLVFARWLPSDLERYEDYRSAAPCAAAMAARSGEDCLRTVPFTVEKTRITTGRGSSYTATLRGAAPFGKASVAFGDPGPLLNRLRPGDRVTVTVWRGDLVVVARGEVRQSSSEAPRDEPQMTAAIGTFAGLLAAQCLGFGAVRLARPRGRRPFTWRPYGRRLFVTTLIVCAVVGFSALSLGLPWWLVPAVAVPLVGGAARLLGGRGVSPAPAPG